MSTLRTLQSTGNPAGPLTQHIRALGPWFHNVRLPDGSQTAPDHPLGDFPACKWNALAPLLPQDMNGMEVLDIGCNAGFYSIELARRGARVMAVDHDPHYLAQAEWLVRQFGLSRRIALERADVYDLAGMRRQFDVVLFLGVMYHLRHPLLGLELAASVCRDTLVVQSLCMPGPAPGTPLPDPGYQGLPQLTGEGWPRMAFVEGELAGDPSNWWVPNPAALDAMIRSTGFAIAGCPETDSRVCKRTAEADAATSRLHKMLAALRSRPAQGHGIQSTVQ
ncbi:MAG: hypothetical protein ABT16_00775 [Rhodanobacter sp. SCN 65-17]|nr:MAG: hypothetical protein ABT16_00775 [Rhodanobacter sp. SCN 65-17]